MSGWGRVCNAGERGDPKERRRTDVRRAARPGAAKGRSTNGEALRQNFPMKRMLTSAALAFCLLAQMATGQAPATKTPARSGPQKKAPTPPPITAKPDELAQIAAKTEQIAALVAELKAKAAAPELVTDVEVYAHAGRMLLAYPDMFTNQGAIARALTTLDQGSERARQLLAGAPQWVQGKRRIHAYTSAIDGAVLPYGVTLPDNYDAGKPTRLYVWLHGRSNTMVETEFIHAHLNRKGAGNPPVAEQGQIQLDCFGRINGAGWHWAGEQDVWESIAALKRRYNIDERRIMIRGFSQGGMGAWHIALHHPDRFAAAEIGAGTVSRTLEQRPELLPFQRATLRIWENISEWALNIHNLPLAGHDGEHDAGQLESSLRARAQLEKEGYPSVGEPDYLRSQGAPGLWMVSKETGHGTSALVRQRLDAFLKEHGDRGQSSPDHVRFLSYTTRYNRSYWVSLEGLAKHYERAEVDARRGEGGATYMIATKNLTRLTLRETTRARMIGIDGQTLAVNGAPQITLVLDGAQWRVASDGPANGLWKKHALQGPIDDAFLDPFLLVRPTGQPWNAAVNDQALRTLARFERLWGRFFRGRPFVKDDQDVTADDLAKYHVVLFGDPGSNAWIAKLNGRLPFTWTAQRVAMGGSAYPASEHYPALIYPNPLNPEKYVVLNSGLTIDDRGYNGDYGTPMWGDHAIVKVKPDAPLPDLVAGGLFDERWRLVP
jgi:pimeloyl-ACP methyl ester carboxylesterase